MSLSSSIPTLTARSECAICRAPLRGPATVCDRCDQEYDARMQRQASANAMAHLKNSGCVSRLFGEHRLDTSLPDAEEPNAAAWASAREWDALSEESVIAVGPPGTGKSFCARALLHQAWMAGRSVRELPTRILAKQAQRFDQGDLLSECGRVGALLLDDLDKARWTEDALTGLWEVLDERRNRQRATIVTTNLSGAELRERLAQGSGGNHSLVAATLDRLLPVRVLTFKGKSLRGRGQG